MDDDEPRSEKRYPLSTAKMSKTPSWIMLGFLLGAVFVAALPPLGKKAAPESVSLRAVEPPPPSGPRAPQPLTTIEDVFATWGSQAVWSDDVTEVALWNSKEGAYADFFEVRRVGDVFYFRSIPRLTRRVIARGKLIPECPLQFTETEEQYRDWLNYGRTERPIERETQTRPRFAPPPGAAPVDRSVQRVTPTLPPVELPFGERPAKK